MKKLLILPAVLVVAVIAMRSADIIVPTETDPIINGTALQSALNSAQCGDTVILQSGATYDGTFLLNDKGCASSSPITVTSSTASALPTRVGPADAPNMARVRTLGGGINGSAFQVQPNAGWWVIDGLEITDNGPNTTIIHMLVDASTPSVHDLAVKRSYIHNKETGSNYSRSIRFGVQFEGSSLLMQGNHINIIGYYQPEIGLGNTYHLDTMAMLSITGNTITVADNFISTWYSGIFTGGGDTDPQNSAVLTDASLSSATFSNVTGLIAGLIVRMGANKTVRVDSVDGNTVTYTPTGVDAIAEPPTEAFWNFGDQGLVHDITVTRNTFYIDPDFALDVIAKNGNIPKGYFEIKNAKRMTVEGNRFIGFPSLIAWTASNQNGTAPWITTSDLVIRNNWFSPDPYTQGMRQAIIIGNNDYLHTDTPSRNVQIHNNLFKNHHGFLLVKGIDGLSLRHNTILNDGVGQGYYNIIGGIEHPSALSFVDNIASYSGAGMQCFTDPFTLNWCFPAAEFSNNAVVDPYSRASMDVWGLGGILNPIVPDFAAVGFTDAASGDYRLLPSSLFKGMASDGADPGVDMDVLLAALGGDIVPPPPPPPPADTEAPTISITATGTKAITVEASAADNVGVVRVEFYLDGVLRSTDFAAPYSYTFNIPGKPGMQHPLFAKAYDAAGNSSQSQTLLVGKNGNSEN